MFVTTAYRVNESMMDKARRMAEDLDIPLIVRGKKSIVQLQKEQNSNAIVVGNESIKLYGTAESEPFFFHPSSAMFRVKRLMEGGSDPMVDAAGLAQGHSFLDCTLGLASDSIVASYVTGSSGSVTGLEGDQYIAYLVKNGLVSWPSGISQLDEAMGRIKVYHSNSLAFLRSLPDQSVDCVYWDPMFDESIEESEGIRALRQFAVYRGFGGEELQESLRVARSRVVLKDHFRSPRFNHFGFEREVRKSSKFHYGYIQK